MDQRRADALIDLLIGRADPPQVHIAVTIPADTLLGETAEPADVAGVGPITSGEALALAGITTDPALPGDRVFAGFSPTSTTPSPGRPATPPQPTSPSTATTITDSNTPQAGTPPPTQRGHEMDHPDRTNGHHPPLGLHRAAAAVRPGLAERQAAERCVYPRRFITS